MDRQEDILAVLRSIEVMLAKSVAMSSLQIELARMQIARLPNVDATLLTNDIARAMKRVERIGCKPSGKQMAPHDVAALKIFAGPSQLKM